MNWHIQYLGEFLILRDTYSTWGSSWYYVTHTVPGGVLDTMWHIQYLGSSWYYVTHTVPGGVLDIMWHTQYLGEFLILCRWFVLESVISCNTAWTWFSMTETLSVVWSWRMGGPPCSWLSVSRLLGPFISNRRTLKNDPNCNTQHYYYYYSTSDSHTQCKLQLRSTHSVNCNYCLHTV